MPLCLRSAKTSYFLLKVIHGDKIKHCHSGMKIGFDFKFINMFINDQILYFGA